MPLRAASSARHAALCFSESASAAAAVAPAVPAVGSVSTHKATHEQHRGTSCTGKYRATRERLDYTWHSHYTHERQALQDSIVDDFLAGGSPPSPRPWLVLTAGPMGAGKSYAMRWLHAAGAFPLDAFVVVDVDRIRDRLPETPLLVQSNRALAGTLTQVECGFIAELIEREALAAARQILVDGSLRDADWYARVIGRVREEHPAYRIAIVLVTASRVRTFERAARRAAVTGREVPRAVLDTALATVPSSFAALAPLVDYAAVIDNEQERAPMLAPPATLETFAAVWRDIERPKGATAAAAAAAVDCARDGAMHDVHDVR